MKKREWECYLYKKIGIRLKNWLVELRAGDSSFDSGEKEILLSCREREKRLPKGKPSLAAKKKKQKEIHKFSF